MSNLNHGQTESEEGGETLSHDRDPQERRIHVDGSVAVDNRQRVLKWMEESESLASLLQGLLDENEQLRARATAAEPDGTRVRDENAGLRKEQEDTVEAFGKLMGEMLRPMNEMMQKIRGTERKSPWALNELTGSAPSSPVSS